MKVLFEDEEFEFSLDEIDVPQARYIKRQTGLSIRGLLNGLAEVDVDCMVAYYWLMKQQNGVVVDMAKVSFQVLKLAEAIGNAMEREDEEKQEREKTERPTKRTRAASVKTQE